MGCFYSVLGKGKGGRGVIVIVSSMYRFLVIVG